MPPKIFFIKTYGCQMNELDSYQIGQLLARKGYAFHLHPENVDLYLINTCSVRDKPAQKLYSDLGRVRILKKKNERMIVGVLGCQAQAEGADLLKKFSIVDFVLGPDGVAKLPDIVDALEKNQKERMAQINFQNTHDYQFVNLLPDTAGPCPVKSFVSIMKGCDNFCSFCIVPYVRGREVSRNAFEIITEIQNLVECGVKEVVLLGQNVNSYGNKLSGSPTFAKLLRLIAEKTDLKRLRFTTSHPKDISQELIDEFKDNPILAPQLHLPVQSGSDFVLNRMYRGYTIKEYLGKIEKLRKAKPDIALATDILVGFSGETDKAFQDTVALLREIKYDSVFAFAYSPRPRTTAARYFEDDVTGQVKAERLEEVLKTQREITYGLLQNRVGFTEEVLVEGFSKTGTSLQGRSLHHRIVHFSPGEAKIGDIVPIRITHAGSNSLMGKETSCQSSIKGERGSDYAH